MEHKIELMILTSKNGRDGWQLVKPDEVPWWVKDPVNMGRLVKGETCMKCDEGEKGSLWYRGMTTDDYRRWMKAQDKRLRKMMRRARQATDTVH